MNKLTKHKFNDLYVMSSGISTEATQAGHGSPFVSFSVVFNNYFLPERLEDLMDTSDQDQATYSIQEGDILLTRTSEVIDELGMSSVSLKNYPKATFSGFLKRLRPKQTDISYAKYMAFYLRSNLFRKTITNNAVMTLRASLNEDIFSYLNVYLPEFEEQKKIGDFLFYLHSKVTLNKKINAEIEKMTRTLFNYWFVQFDFPNDEGKPYKSSGGKMIWSEKLKKEIPSGWDVKCLADIVNISNESLNPLTFPDKEFKHYSIPAYDKNGSYDIELGKDIKSDKYIVLNSDILVSKLNPRFSRVIYAADETNTICSTEFVVWRSTNNYLKNYLFMIARDPSFISYCSKSATGTSNSHRRINPTTMMNYSLPYNSEVIERFGMELEPILKKYSKNITENKVISDFMEWLIPMFINGQLKIKD